MHGTQAAPGSAEAEKAGQTQLPLEHLGDFFLISPNPYVVLDPRWTIVACNPAYQAVTGRRAEDILGRNLFEAFPSEPGSVSDRQLRASLERVTRERAVDHLSLIRYDIATAEGLTEERYWSATHTPLFDANGEVALVLQHTVDVTELHRLRVLAEQAGESTRASLVQGDVFRRARAVQETNIVLEGGLRRLHQLFDQAPGFMAVLSGPDHVFELANRAYLDVVGRKDIIGKTVGEALPEISEQGFIKILDQVYATGEPFLGRGVPVMLKADPAGPADERWLDFVYQPVADDGGRITGIFVQGVDVTDEKRAATALRESEARFRSVAESAPVMLWMGDPNGKCLYLNRALRKFWGVEEADVVGFDWNKTLNRDDRLKLYVPFATAMRDRVPLSVEARYRRSDGAWRILQTQAHPRFDSDGAFLGMIGVNVDVTDARAAEAALREETNSLEILNKTGVAIAAELDLEKLVQIVTDAGVELTGAEFGAFFYNVVASEGESYMLYTISGAPKEAFANFPMPRNTELFAPTFGGKGVVRSDDILRDPRYGKNAPRKGMPEGHLPVRSYLAVPVSSRSGEVIGGLFFGHGKPGVFSQRSERLVTGLASEAAIAIDNARLFQAAEREIQQRRDAEKALQELNATLEEQVLARTREVRERDEALRQSQKMEVVGQLTGGIAHDFNNLLQIVCGNLEILQRNLATESGRLRRAADNAMNGARRAATLTQRLLAFSRRQPLDPKPFNPNKLVSDMSELFHRTLGEAVAVETVLAAGLWEVEADANQLESAILNLAVNARDAMPNGGKLTIETANTRIDESYARTHAEVSPGQYVVLCVSDTGVGMDRDTLGRVFEPFFTTKEAGKGTGLGLSMVYGFVKQSGGHVKIYSEPGHGTTVKIYLPRYLGVAQVEEVTLESLVPEGSREETILVLEDDDDVRTYSVEILRELGYRVVEAHDGPSALRLLGRQAHVDLLFTDVILPGGETGADIAQAAQQLRPELKVLFTTGYARDAIVHHGRLMPGVDLITKPFTYGDLARKIRDVLDA